MKEFFKTEGIYRNLKWLCSRNCLDKEEKELKEEDQNEEDNSELREEEDLEEYDPMNDF